MESGNCIVALIDILGARTSDPEVTKRLHGWMDFLRERLRSRTARMLADDPYGSLAELREPRYMAFGDSLQFLWNVNVNENAHVLALVGTVLSSVFIEALKEGIPIRGALTYGHAQYDRQVALGPAISDAAAWYERVDALAVVATPRTGFLLEQLEMQEGQNYLPKAFTKYEFELAKAEGKKTTQELWAISWPAVLRANNPEYDACKRRGAVLGVLSKFVMPPGTESKYQNTLKFFDHYEAKWPASGEAPPGHEDGR